MKSFVASMAVFGVLTFGAIHCTATNSLEGDYNWLSKPNNIQSKMSITEDKFFVSKQSDGWTYRVVEEKENIIKLVVYEYNEPMYAKQMILEKKEDGVYVYRQSPSGKFSLIGIANKR